MDLQRDRADDFSILAVPSVQAFAVEDAPARDPAYRPNRFDLRFLPRPLRFVKDALRAELGAVSEAISRAPVVGDRWNWAISAYAVRDIERAGIIFIHIPKTGGTSISKVLYRRNLPHFGAAFYAKHAPASFGRLPSFAVIRDPIERAISSWRFVRGAGSDDMAYNLYDRWRLDGLERFDDFVAFLARTPLERIPATFHEQVGWVSDGRGRLIVDQLFAFRSSEGAPRGLGPWLGTSLPHLNASTSYDVSCSEQSLETLRRIYARDLHLYEHLIAQGGHASVKGLPLG